MRPGLIPYLVNDVFLLRSYKVVIFGLFVLLFWLIIVIQKRITADDFVKLKTLHSLEVVFDPLVMIFALQMG